MFFKQIFEEKLAQYAYLIGCQETGEAIVIDPMRDIYRYEKIAAHKEFRVVAAADTHIHADYLTGLREFAEKGIKVYASDEGGDDWKYEWLHNSGYDYRLLKDGDEFSIGNIRFKVWHTPGHTPEHLSYTLTDGSGADAPMGLFSGDFIFVGDVGRPDLLESAAGQKGAMESSARTLYRSVLEFENQPEYWQIWPAHGAGSACGKTLGAVPESTVGYELRFNPAIRSADSEQHFVDYILEGQPEPPLYFARMKRENRSGPAVLGSLPQPAHLEFDDFISKGRQKGAVILDTREKSIFMSAHLPGSLLSPLDRSFNTVAGSYIHEDENIYMIVEEHSLEEAVRDLIRIGLDRIKGFITPSDLDQNGEELEKIDRISFDQMDEIMHSNNAVVLDVRKGTEYNEKHIEGAVNISHTRLLERKTELSKDKTLLVHCRSGRRASVASALLARDGYKVKWIDDHIDNW